MKTLTKLFNKLPLWGKVVTVILIIIAIYLLYKKIMTTIQNSKKNDVLNNSTVTVGSGTSQTTIDLGAKAAQIYDAFHNYWGGMAEDEETAIAALKSVPTNQVSKLSQIYFNLYAKNLKEEFIKYTDFNQVSFKFV